MKSKAIVAIALLLTLNIAFAVPTNQRRPGHRVKDIAKTNVTKSTFVIPPTVVVDSASSQSFLNATVDSICYSPGKTADTVYVWRLKWGFSQSKPVSIVKRTLDASTLQQKGDDIIISTSMTTKIGAVGRPGYGYIGIPTMKDSGKNTADNLFFSVLPASAESSSSLIETQITSNSNAKTGHYFVDVWWHDDYFYTIYIRYDKQNEYEDGIFLQAIKGEDGSLLYSSPIQVASFKNSPGSTNPLGGLNKNSGADTIFVLWKDDENSNVMQSSVQIATGKVSKAIIVATDSDTDYNIPSGIITSSNTYGTVIGRETYRNQKTTYSLDVFFNSNFNNRQQLAFQTPAGYEAPSIKSFDKKDGFNVVAMYYGENDAAFILRSFNDDGSAQGSQKVIGYSRGNMLFFSDADGALWLGYSDFDATTGVTEKSYLGKLSA